MTSIAIERLTTGTIIHHKGGEFGSFGGFAEVVSIVDEGDDGFYVSTRIQGWPEEAGEVSFYVMPGETVEFGGVGQPVLAEAPDAFLSAYQARQAQIARDRIRAADEADEDWRGAEDRARAYLAAAE